MSAPNVCLPGGVNRAADRAADKERPASLRAVANAMMMTSFAFIFGMLPLVLATGAGAEMRQALGTAVFFGMLGVTLFGLLFTPVLYVLVRAMARGGKHWQSAQPSPAAVSQARK
jgi:hypothetical protein